MGRETASVQHLGEVAQAIYLKVRTRGHDPRHGSELLTWMESMVQSISIPKKSHRKSSQWFELQQGALDQGCLSLLDGKSLKGPFKND